MDKTHFINTRDTTTFDIIKNPDSENTIFNELYYYHNTLKNELKNENINYDNLKKCLIPANNGDVAFIFDWQNIERADYGDYILSLLLPFLLNNNFCYLHGDYISLIDSEEIKINKINAINNAVYKKTNTINSLYTSYVVYITNIGLKKALKIDSYLSRNEISYIGFADLNINNLFKSFLSATISQSFIKSNNNIIQCNEDSLECYSSTNPCFLSLKKYFNKFIEVPSYYYNLFLLYKIPCLVEPQNKDRQLYYSFKYLNQNIDNNFIKNYSVMIDDRKINYLYNKKTYITDKWNIENPEELKKFLTLKIEQSLLFGEIFNLELKKEDYTYQFDICIEHLNLKYSVGLKLIPKEQQIRFITLSSIKIK